MRIPQRAPQNRGTTGDDLRVKERFPNGCLQQQKVIAHLSARLKEQTAQIQKVSAQLEATKLHSEWSTIPRAGPIFVADAHRGDGKRFVGTLRNRQKPNQ